MQSTVDTVSQFNWYIRLTIFPFAINLPLLFLIRQHLPPSADVTVTLTHNSVSVDSTSADDVMVTSRVTPYYVTTTRRSRLCRRQQPSEHLQVTRASLQCIVANRRLLCATCGLIVTAAVKCTVFIQTGFFVCADYFQKQSLGGFAKAGWWYRFAAIVAVHNEQSMHNAYSACSIVW